MLDLDADYEPKKSYLFELGYKNWVQDVTTNIWLQFTEKIQKLYDINAEELLVLLGRLDRVGVYRKVLIQEVSNEQSHEVGKTTILYERFVRWIELEVDVCSIDD
ncbi:MAG: hypothetical protein AAF846_28900 [Chloroflexota bacterium]